MFGRKKWSELKPFTKRQIYFIVLGILLLLVLVPIFAYSNQVVSKSKADYENAPHSSSLTYDEAVSQNIDGLIIIAVTTQVDSNAFTYKVRFIVKPSGFMQGDTAQGMSTAARRFTLQLDNTVVSVAQGQIVRAREVTMSIEAGSPSSYPFDVYSGLFTASAETVDPVTNATVAVPIWMANTMGTTGWQVDQSFVNFANSLTVTLSFQRSFTSKFFAFFVIIIMWVLSIMMLTLASTLWLRERKVEPPTISLSAALLFALPALRNSQPGAPAIGCTADVAGFFWNIAMVGLSVFLLMLNYIVKYKRDKQGSPRASPRASPRLSMRRTRTARPCNAKADSLVSSDTLHSHQPVSAPSTTEAPPMQYSRWEINSAQ